MACWKSCGPLIVVLLVILVAECSALKIHKKPFEVNTGKARLIIDVQGAENSAESSQSQESSVAESSSSSSSSMESSSVSSSSMSEESSSEGSMSFSSESGSSESGSSESGSSASSPRRKQPPRSDNYGLPPEPEAAKGYTPRPSCNEDHCDILEETSSQDSFSIQSSDTSSDQGCTTNCAPDTSSRPLVGPSTYSQPLGDFNNGMVTVPQTQTVAQPARGASMVSGSTVPASLTISVQDGSSSVSSSSSSSSSQAGSCGCNTCPCANNGLVAASPLIGTSSCGCDSCPCPDSFDATPLASSCNEPGCTQLSEAERRAREHEKELAAIHEEKEKKRNALHQDMRKHQENMSKIESLMRSLSFQYSELRRSHEALRNHIGANKAALRQVAGVSDTGDLDIEDKSPDFTDTLDSIPELPSKSPAQLQKEIEAAQNNEVNALKSSHARAHNIVKDFLAHQK